MAVRGLGNYRFAAQVERTPAVLMLYRGAKAVVRLHDGSVYALPAQLLREIGANPGDRFMLLVTRRAGEVEGVRAEPLAAARPRMTPQTAPKIMVRDGKKLSTRK